MKNRTMWIVCGVIVIVVYLSIIGGKNSHNSSSQITPNITQPSPCSDTTSLKNQAEAVDFKELDKNPGSFNGKFAKFTGQVVQIQEADNYGIMRLSVTKESYGWSMNDIVYVDYQNHTSAVKDDIVTIYGQMTGSKTYESQAHFSITIPSITACIIEKSSGITQNETPTKIVPPKTASTEKSVTQNKPTQQTATQPIPTPSAPQTPSPIIQTEKQNILPTSNETVSQQNAVKKAKSYLDFSAFSHDGLVEQLEYGQFSHADAVYGVDNSGANWNEQALKKAKSYLEYSTFSRDGLVEQLEYSKFSNAEAIYGTDNAGANWLEQAAKKAKSYMEYSAFSRGGLIDQLKYSKFTQEQAEYGANAVGL